MLKKVGKHKGKLMSLFKLIHPNPQQSDRISNPSILTPSPATFPNLESIAESPSIDRPAMPTPNSHRPRSLFKQGSFPRSPYKSPLNMMILFACFFFTLFQIQIVTRPAEIIFFPLKDPSIAEAAAMTGNTWFMSDLNDTAEPGEAQHLRFPSPDSAGRLLCLEGTKSYALAPIRALPPGARFIPGLTFVSESFYSYDNIFHGLTALSPFVALHERNRCTASPARWLLFEKGKARRRVNSPWVRALMEATFGSAGLEIDEGGEEEEVRCFEEAVVFRHNQGSMGAARKERVYDLMRCRARAYCNVSGAAEGADGSSGVGIALTLLLRVGPRAFRDDDAVIGIFRRECAKVEGCTLKVMRPNNLTFCDQVKLMSETDVLASPHGAQLTNMFYMDKNSSVMEFFPKGWLELAGVGQHVYQWVAIWSRMRHQGVWHDPHGDPCPYDRIDSNLTEGAAARMKPSANCFSFYKGAKVGHDEGFFSNWTAKVLNEVRRYKAEKSLTSMSQEAKQCNCG